MADKKLKYAFSGSHGVGKTTSAFKMAYDCKIKYFDKTVNVITDVPKGNPYWISNNKKPSKLGQLWGFNEQLELERISEKEYDITVSDRTIVDYIGYSIYSNFDLIASSQFDIAREYIKTYDEIYYISIKNNIIDDGIRNVDKDFQKDYDKILRELFNMLNVKLIEI